MKPSDLHDLVIANRILANEGVVDAFGHVSIRNPEDPNRYFQSRSRAPELVTADDLMEFGLAGDAIDLQGRTPYSERMIHGAIYEARPEINAVIHNHAYEVIPFGVTGVPLRPIMRACGVIGSDIPTWDIRDRFGETNHLVVNMDQGRDLVHCLGNRRAAKCVSEPAGLLHGGAERYVTGGPSVARTSRPHRKCSCLPLPRGRMR